MTEVHFTPSATIDTSIDPFEFRTHLICDAIGARVRGMTGR